MMMIEVVLKIKKEGPDVYSKNCVICSSFFKHMYQQEITSHSKTQAKISDSEKSRICKCEISKAIFSMRELNYMIINKGDATKSQYALLMQKMFDLLIIGFVVKETIGKMDKITSAVHHIKSLKSIGMYDIEGMKKSVMDPKSQINIHSMKDYFTQNIHIDRILDVYNFDYLEIKIDRKNSLSMGIYKTNVTGNDLYILVNDVNIKELGNRKEVVIANMFYSHEKIDILDLVKKYYFMDAKSGSRSMEIKENVDI